MFFAFTIYQTSQTCQTSQIPETYPLTPDIGGKDNKK